MELKCPFSCRDKSFDEAAKDRAFCLEEDTFLGSSILFSSTTTNETESFVILWFGEKMVL